MEEKFQKKIEKLTAEVAQKRKKRNIVVLLRIIAFLATALSVYVTWGTPFLIPAFLVLFGLFLFMVRTDSGLQREIKLLRLQLEFYRVEMNALKLDVSNRETGTEFSEPDHPYSADMDLFGKSGLYPLLNRAVSEPGKQYLAKLLCTFETGRDLITARTRLVQSLRDEDQLHSRYFAVLQSAQLSTKELESVRSRLGSDRKPFTRGLYLSSAFGLLSVLVIALVAADYLSVDKLFYWIGLGWILSSLLMKSSGSDFKDFVNDAELLSKVGKALDLLRGYELDERVLGCERMEDLRSFKKVSKLADLTESRANLLISSLFNGLALWDLFLLYRLRKVHNECREDLMSRLDTAVRFDAWNGLIAYAGRYPERPYATLVESGFKAKNIGHPLIPDEQRVDNDFELAGDCRFAIVTGANMAGKSTFLRSVGVNMILAQAGLPVTAEELRFKPVQLYTSMHTNDDLGEGESYFFAELKRLKGIVTRLEKGEELFLVLDEILKGTNSQDKAEGSKQFLKKLLKEQVRGIIATHDISLCDLEKDHPQKVKNLRFEIEYLKGNLKFDYRLEPGRCQNMNASYLLKDMGLV